MSLSEATRGCFLCPHLREEQGVIKNTERKAEPVPAFVGKAYKPGGLAVVFDTPSYHASQRGRAMPTSSQDGALFTELVYAAGLDQEELLLTHTVRCRPPGNRLRDYPEAVFNCGSWTAAEMDAYAPRVVVLMGATAIQSIFSLDAKVNRMRGTFRSLKPDHTWGARLCVCTFHPTAARFDGGMDSEPGRMIIKDLQTAKRALEVLNA